MPNYTYEETAKALAALIERFRTLTAGERRMVAREGANPIEVVELRGATVSGALLVSLIDKPAEVGGGWYALATVRLEAPCGYVVTGNWTTSDDLGWVLR